MVGHNVSFDLAVLQRECERAGIAWQMPPALCTRLLAQVAEPHLHDYSLDSVATWLGVEIAGRHSALGDATAAARIFRALVPTLRDRGIRTVAEALRASRGLTAVVDRQVSAGWSEAAPAWSASAPEQTARRDVYPYRHRVGSIMTSPPTFLRRETTLAAAVELMLQKRISSVFVSSGGARSRPEDTGIVTERDLLRALGAHGLAALTKPVGELMSHPLAAVPADALVYAAIGRMNRLKVRHLGVTDTAGDVVGALSSRDLLRQRAEGAVELGDEIDQAKDVHDLGRAWAKLPKIVDELRRENLVGLGNRGGRVAAGPGNDEVTLRFWRKRR